MIDLSVSLSNFLNNIFSIVSEFGLNGQKDGQSFYSSVNQCYSLLNATLKRIPKEAVENILEKSDLFNNPTKAVLINLLKRIEDHCMEILYYAYVGDLRRAMNKLNSLFTKKTYIQSKFKNEETYIDNINRVITNDSLRLYRIVCLDNTKSGNYKHVPFDSSEKDFWRGPVESKDKNCLHIPFNLREKAASNRFNLQGYPCSYLADSIDCAKKESVSFYNNQAVVEKGKSYHLGVFKTKGGKPLILLDLRMPRLSSLLDNDYSKLVSSLISLPIIIICNGNSERFGKEAYLFSQLLLHFLLRDAEPYRLLPSFNGICYSSLKCLGGSCYMFPATYNNNNNNTIPATYVNNEIVQNIENPQKQPFSSDLGTRFKQIGHCILDI